MARCFAVGMGAGPCDSARQDHHLIKKQRIRKVWRTRMRDWSLRGGERPPALTTVLSDPRLLVVTCWRHHKPLEEEVLKPELGDEFWAAVAEYGLQGELPRYLMVDTERTLRALEVFADAVTTPSIRESA